MSQACSQHPAPAGSASRTKWDDAHELGHDRDKTLFRWARVLAMLGSHETMWTAISDGDPLPPDDRDVPPQLDRLYREEQPKLLRLLRRHTSPDHALDVVQHVFAKVLRRPSHAMRAPDAYLRRAAINQVRDDARKDQRQARGQHVSHDLVRLTAPDQVVALEARDMLRRLESVISALKPRTREIFLAHRIDGYSYAEIATRTGLSVKAVEKQMSKAIAHIDRQLERP